jgi:hypothetical protein
VAGSYTNFVQGATQASFGPGISVGGGTVGALGPVTVTSPTSATAHLSISASAQRCHKYREFFSHKAR